jgi:hypothetical protein
MPVQGPPGPSLSVNVARTVSPSSLRRARSARQGSVALKFTAAPGERSRNGRPWSMIAPGAK